MKILNKPTVAFALFSVAIFGLIFFIFSHFFGDSNKLTEVKPKYLKTPVPSAPVVSVSLGPASGVALASENPNARSVSFESSSDFWSFAQDALRSGNVAKLYEARTAARECIGLFNWIDEFGILSSGGKSQLPGPLTPERQLAVSNLIGRCQGFILHGASESKGLWQTVSERLVEVGGKDFGDIPSPQTSEPQTNFIKALVESNSPAAMEMAIPYLGDSWMRENKISHDDPRRRLISTAVMLSMCNLGRDCSASGYSATLICATTGRCSGGLWGDWKHDFSEAEIISIENYENEFTTAINSRNWASLGLTNQREQR